MPKARLRERKTYIYKPICLSLRQNCVLPPPSSEGGFFLTIKNVGATIGRPHFTLNVNYLIVGRGLAPSDCEHKCNLIRFYCLSVVFFKRSCRVALLFCPIGDRKGGKNASFLGGVTPPKYAEFMCQSERFARYVSYKFAVQNGISIISLFSHRCETRLRKTKTEASHILPSFF